MKKIINNYWIQLLFYCSINSAIGSFLIIYTFSNIVKYFGISGVIFNSSGDYSAVTLSIGIIGILLIQIIPLTLWYLFMKYGSLKGREIDIKIFTLFAIVFSPLLLYFIRYNLVPLLTFSLYSLIP